MTSRRASRRNGHRPRPPRRHTTTQGLAHVAGLDPDAEYGVIPAWCAHDAIDEAKQRTHDTLIQLMGPTRAGAVHWRISSTIADAHEMLDVLVPDSAPEFLDVIRQIRGHLREYGGHVVIALAPGHPPAPGGPPS